MAKNGTKATPKPKAAPKKKAATAEVVEKSETKVVERPKAKVIAKKLNLRTDASKEASVMTVLNEGQIVELIATDENSEWSWINCEVVAGVKMEGFVMSKFLEGI